MIEGVYVLKEAHVGDEVVLPPRVSGRFVLRSGVVITILHYRLTDEDQTSTSSFGHYVLDAEHFSYRYDDPMVLRQTKGVNTVSRVPPWDGMRAFKITVENRAVRLQTENAKQELLFSHDGLTYSENGRVQRVWQRVAEPQ
jgi:hypothetical protein